MEIWKDIQGYEGLYQVSNMGRIKSLPRIVERNGQKMRLKATVLRPQKCTNGYLFVCLSNRGEVKQFLIHRLVANAFIPNGNGEINHIDENKANNALYNLEWLSHSENIRHGTCIERSKRNHNQRGCNNPMYGRTGSKSPQAKRIIQCDMDGKPIASYDSIIEAAQAMERNAQSISNALKGRTKHCKHFIWKYE